MTPINDELRWAVRVGSAWCAIADNTKPQRMDAFVPTACGLAITRPFRVAWCVVDCADCARTLDRPNAEPQAKRSTGPDADGLAAREAYRAAWKTRLEGVLTAEWQWSNDLAHALGESNAKIVERMRDLVDAALAERCIVKASGVRKSSSGGTHRAYFRLAIGVRPPAPRIVGEPQRLVRRPPRRASPTSRPRPVVPAANDPAAQAALEEAIGMFAATLSPDDRLAIVRHHEQTRSIDQQYDRRLLAACGAFVGRLLTVDEKRQMRAVFLAQLSAGLRPSASVTS